MRPRLYYAIFDMGQVIAVRHGATAARQASPGSHRPYKGFRTELEAEEFAMWWNHQHPTWLETRNTSSPPSA